MKIHSFWMLILMDFCIFRGVLLLKMKIQLLKKLQKWLFWRLWNGPNWFYTKSEWVKNPEISTDLMIFSQKMTTVYHNSCNCPSWSLKALKVSRIGEGIFQLLYDKGNIQRWVESSVKAKGVSRTNSIKKKMMSCVLFGRNLGNIWIDFWSQKDIFKGIFLNIRLISLTKLHNLWKWVFCHFLSKGPRTKIIISRFGFSITKCIGGTVKMYNSFSF